MKKGDRENEREREREREMRNGKEGRQAQNK